MRAKRKLVFASAITLAVLAGLYAAGFLEPLSPVNRAAEYRTHLAYAALTKESNPPLAFFGDSITYGWNHAIWDSTFMPLGAANYGYNGDSTSLLLWRMEHGELGTPKVIVLLIGSNDLALENHTPEETANGVFSIIDAIHRLSPGTSILLMGVFQRGDGPQNSIRYKVTRVNELLNAHKGDAKLRYIDISGAFVAPDGSPAATLRPDHIHLNKLGYAVWADAIEGPIKEFLAQ